ncbi:hypothetical protein C8F04DRAFT_527315 [Mycena alexandri]|uniref:SAP domain-containing protein n=1 Tax=Mycena alexandri TaxID=1745969 RepID=A0AAD6XHA6_9AGAR|nr:hypothetical protein C8F04DRAFT_527315 [Mycena alexandri]
MPPPQLIPLDSIAGGVITRNRTLTVLYSIAAAVGLDATGKKDDILPRIMTKLTEDPEFAQRPEHMKFSVYRANKTAQKTSKNGRSSAVKAAEDAEEDKRALPATGAHRTLTEGKASIDPPPQFARLEGPTKKNEVLEHDDQHCT